MKPIVHKQCATFAVVFHSFSGEEGLLTLKWEHVSHVVRSLLQPQMMENADEFLVIYEEKLQYPTFIPLSTAIVV